MFGSLDNPGSFLRTHERTDLILNEFDPAIVWKEYGIRSDVVVSDAAPTFSHSNDTSYIAVHTWVPASRYSSSAHP